MEGVWCDDVFEDWGKVVGSDDALWVGYLSYDLGRYVEELPELAEKDRDWPIALMHRCEGWLAYDQEEKKWWACGSWGEAMPGWLMEVGERMKKGKCGVLDYEVGTIKALISQDEHEENVERTLEYIRAGDVFEVNVAQRVSASFKGSTRGLFHDLINASPAWYSAYMECLGEEWDGVRRTVGSISPELFLQVDEGGRVVTRPIKGTRPASVDPMELLESIKDQAELNMVVDMMRNDLGRVCRYGSMQVSEERVIESHPTVHHGVSTIEGVLREGMGLKDLIRATMPGGSITGAPKVRAMEIIEELEPVRRGLYTGAIGAVYKGEMVMSIAIRTTLVEQDKEGCGRMDYSVGGGIVADSVAREEYLETLDKMAAMKKAVGQA